eukprot:tig00001126_g7120.t1
MVDYLEKFAVTHKLEVAVNELLRSRPQDPFEFLAHRIAKMSVEHPQGIIPQLSDSAKKSLGAEMAHMFGYRMSMEEGFAKARAGGKQDEKPAKEDKKPEPAKPAPAPAPAAADDDDVDLFADETPEEEAAREARLKAIADANKKVKKAVIAKSSLLIDVKPWDDTTDMKKLEECVRSIQMDGLVWGQSKLVPVAFGVKKLQINAVIEDDKVSTDELEEQIVAFEDYVQSFDIAAFNKI